MAVAFDAVSNVAAGTGNLSWTHTPVGTPRGVKVEIVENGGTNGVTAVTYGGVAMELAAVNAKTSGEAGTVITYFLGRGVPTGAQTVSVTVSDAVSKRAVATTVTASTDTCWISADISIGSDSIANPSSTLNLLGKTCFVSLAGHSGQNGVTGTGQSTGWTNRLEHAFGAQTGVWYSYNTISTANVACGWTQTADDAVMVAIAITEAPIATDTHAVGLTESASITVVFDSRAIPILITESASVTIVNSVGTADGEAVQLSESSAITSKSITCGDSLGVGISELGVSLGLSFYASDTVVVQIPSESSSKTESGSTAQQALPIPLTDTASITAIYQNVSDQAVVQSSESSSISSSTPSFTVSDSLSLTASESAVVPFPYAVEANSISLTESRPVITAQGGELVLLVADSVAVAVTETVTNISVFIPGSLQNFVVSDGLKVQLNGEGIPPVSITASDTIGAIVLEPSDQQGALYQYDSLAVQMSEVASVTTTAGAVFFASDSCSLGLTESATLSTSVVLSASDSMRVQVVEDVPEEVTALTCSDSVLVSVLEPNDQNTQLGVLDSVAVQANTETLQIGGLLSFSVTDGIAPTLSEVSGFGSCTVGAVDSCRLVASEILTNSASVAATESIRAIPSEVATLFKDISTVEALAVQFADSAAPIFNNFVALTASDSVSIQCSDTINSLVSFLTQISTTDSVTAQADESITAQSVTAFANEQSSVTVDEIADIFNPASVADALKCGTLEQGLAIPIVSVNVSTFADDTIFGEIESDAAVSIVYEAIEKTASDGLGIQSSEDTRTQAGYYSEDACLVGVNESASYAAVANASPETWHGGTGTEHRHNKPKPWRFYLTDKFNW